MTEIDNMDLNFAGEIIKKALKKGADSAEVFISTDKGTSVEVKDGEIEALEASHEVGFALRVLKNGRTGFSFATSASAAEKAVNDAVEAARWTAEDKNHIIPQMLKPSEVSVFDRAIETISEEDLIKSAIQLEASALSYDKRIKRVRKAEVSCSSGETIIFNSNGIASSYMSSDITAQVSAFAEDESGDAQIGSGYVSLRRLADLDLKSVGVSASERALELLGSRTISATKLPVILPPFISVEFLEVLSASFSADAVQKQRSFFADKMGKDVASPFVEIIDDGTMQWGSGSSPVDDEGVPTSEKALISGGRLNGFLHNSYTARKAGTVSTGNAVRHGAKGLPGVGVTNIYIKPDEGGKGRDGLISSMAKGALITSVMGVHMANPVSGDFSIGISGIMIEGGKRQYPFKEAVISGNILDLFKKVEEVGSDLEFYGSAGSPSLFIGAMDISA